MWWRRHPHRHLGAGIPSSVCLTGLIFWRYFRLCGNLQKEIIGARSFCKPDATAFIQPAVSALKGEGSGTVSDCGVKDPKFESHCRQLCFS